MRLLAALIAVVFSVAAHAQSIDSNGPSTPPNGTAGGCLAGTYPNPSIASGCTITSPTLVTPVIGVATGTSLGLSGALTAPSTTTASGDATIGAATGNVRVGTGSVPTIASGACGAGANGTIAAGSRSNAGTVQIGAVATTTCTVVFAAAMTTAPVCVFAPADSAGVGATVLAFVSANTVNGFVITGTALASVNFNYICL